MEVLNPNVALLSNHEVFKLVNEVCEQMKVSTGNDKKKNRHHQGVGDIDTISYELKQYMADKPGGMQSDGVVVEFLDAIKKFNLTKAEKLQLLNLRPTSESVFLRLVEEGEERFETEEIEEIMELIVKILPAPPQEDGMDEEGTFDEQDGDEDYEEGHGVVDDLQESVSKDDYENENAPPEDELVAENDQVESDGEKDD